MSEHLLNKGNSNLAFATPATMKYGGRYNQCLTMGFKHQIKEMHASGYVRI